MPGEAKFAGIRVSRLPQYVCFGWQDLKEALDEPWKPISAICAQGNDNARRPALLCIHRNRRFKCVEYGSAIGPLPASPRRILGIQADARYCFHQATSHRRPVNPCRALDVVAMYLSSTRECEVRQCDCRARAHYCIDVPSTQNAVSIRQIADDVDWITTSYKGSEIDVLTFKQRSALRSIEGDPSKGLGGSRQPLIQMVQLLEMTPSRCDQ